MKKIKLPKRMTQKFAAEHCLKQWRWIIKQIRAGDTRGVETLKGQWIEDHDLAYEVSQDCFYCEYAVRKTRQYQSFGCRDCKYCPARKIDPTFYCTGEEYNYARQPEKFYKELLRLKRLGVKK